MRAAVSAVPAAPPAASKARRRLPKSCVSQLPRVCANRLLRRKRMAARACTALLLCGLLLHWLGFGSGPPTGERFVSRSASAAPIRKWALMPGVLVKANALVPHVIWQTVQAHWVRSRPRTSVVHAWRERTLECSAQQSLPGVAFDGTFKFVTRDGGSLSLLLPVLVARVVLAGSAVGGGSLQDVVHTKPRL